MKTHSLPPDTGLLLNIAQSVVWKLEEKQEELGIDSDAEALLRTSIAAAEFGINRYLAFALAGKKSPEALMFLEEAKVRCDRSIEQLRRRVSRSIGLLCRILDAVDLSSVAERVIAVTA
jgi:hypothetical protein